MTCYFVVTTEERPLDNVCGLPLIFNLISSLDLNHIPRQICKISSRNSLETPTKPNPQKMLQIQPSRNRGVRRSCNIPMTRHITEECILSVNVHSSLLVKQKTLTEAVNVPSNTNFKIHQSTGYADSVVHIKIHV